MSRHRIGPVTIDVDLQDIRECITGFKVAFQRRGEPIRSELIPNGWELRLSRGWPVEWLHPTGYWVSIWRIRSGTGEHITIEPKSDGWRVEHNLKNSWMGGRTVDSGLNYGQAVSVALNKAAEISAESVDGDNIPVIENRREEGSDAE